MRIKGFASLLFSLLLISALGFGGYVFFKDMDGPTIVMTPDTDRISPHREVTITLNDPSNVRSVTVSVRKNNVSTVILKKHFSPYQKEEKVTFSLKNAGIREGAFDLEIKATDASLAGFGQGNNRTQVWPMRMDVQPPRISVKTLPPNVRRGGSAVIRYTINKEVSSSGVRVGDTFFPGYLQADNSYISFFPFPHNLTPDQYTPEITAEDLAGNVTTSRLTVRALNRTFKQDILNLTDDFLNKVSQHLFELAPDAANPLERFLIINRDVRTANMQFLLHQARDTEGSMLWDGVFIHLPRSATRANYADHRTYMYQGQKIDDQFHLGLDLASLKNAAVPVANNGRVVFGGNLGIYGNVVIVDHGMGLMSLYSHLNDIAVTAGSTLNKGDIVGHTGTTGMAFGDHLHFGMMIGGVEVTPIEWLDPKWIRDNITGRLNPKR